VPGYANTIPYTLGGTAFVSFLVLVLTGIVLTQFYHPSTTGANASVHAIAADPVLSLVRNIHFWLAQAMFVAVLLHLFRVFATGAYKRPRELQWVVGVLLFAASIALLFTGAVIKWDEEGYEALQHNEQIANALAGPGGWFASSYFDAVHIVVRLYSLHVSLLPMAMGGLLLLHFFLIRHHKIAPPVGAEAAKAPGTTVPFTVHLRKIFLYGGAVVGIVLVLALFFPAPLGPAPIDGVEATKPPWPFLWLYGVENYFGLGYVFPATMAFFIGLLAVPLIDRSKSHEPKDRRFIIALGFAVSVLLLALTLSAALSPVTSHF
jgi:quinol-cytochrome oxidoreductase complex cytochrome b subunit